MIIGEKKLKYLLDEAYTQGKHDQWLIPFKEWRNEEVKKVKKYSEVKNKLFQNF